MANGFDTREGIIKSLKTALRGEGFASAVMGMLAGEKGAGEKVERALKDAAGENTLNEIVSVRRLYGAVSEGVFDKGKTGGLMTRLDKIRRKSDRFQRKVLVRTLKKPGMLKCLIHVIRALCTAGYPVDDVLATPQAIRLVVALGETAIEVAREERKAAPALNEAVIAERARRVMRHASRRVVSEEFGAQDGTVDRYGGRMPVNVYTGRFQPFHLGHLSNLQAAAERGLRTVICPVMAGKTPKSIAGHPFNGKIEEEMFNRLKSAYGDLIADIIPIARPSLDCWVEAVRERGMEPITWTTGADRKPSYENMIAKYGPDFNLVDNFEVIGLDKDMDAEGGNIGNTAGISGTAIRKCLVDGNEDGFKEQMPECLWDMYGEFRDALLSSVAPSGQLSEGSLYDIIHTARSGAVSESKRRFFEQLQKDLDGGLMNVMG